MAIGHVTVSLNTLGNHRFSSFQADQRDSG